MNLMFNNVLFDSECGNLKLKVKPVISNRCKVGVRNKGLNEMIWNYDMKGISLALEKVNKIKEGKK